MLGLHLIRQQEQLNGLVLEKFLQTGGYLVEKIVLDGHSVLAKVHSLNAGQSFRVVFSRPSV